MKKLYLKRIEEKKKCCGCEKEIKFGTNALSYTYETYGKKFILSYCHNCSEDVIDEEIQGLKNLKEQLNIQ